MNKSTNLYIQNLVDQDFHYLAAVLLNRVPLLHVAGNAHTNAFFKLVHPVVKLSFVQLQLVLLLCADPHFLRAAVSALVHDG